MYKLFINLVNTIIQQYGIIKFQILFFICFQSMNFFIKLTLVATVALVGIFSVFNFAKAAGGSWQVVGAAQFSSSTIATTPIVFSSSGTPYVAYKDASNGNKATVMKYDGSSWITVGNADFSPDQAGDVSLAINASGTPYVAFTDAASSSRATVMKYDGSSWVTVGSADFSSSTAAFTKIAFSPSDVPYVAYSDVSSSNAITITKFNGSSWVPVGSPYISARGAVPVFAFSSTGTPFVAFSDIGTGQPTIITFDGAGWNLVGVPIAAMNLAASLSMAISPSDTLYVSAADISDYHPKMFTFNGTSWVQVGSTINVVSSGDTSLAFSPSGVIYMAFEQNGNKATVMKYNGSDWVAVGDQEFSAAAINPISLAFSPDGTPYVAYSDTTGGAYSITVMAFLPTVPGQVTGLSVAPQSSTAISLSWNIPSDNGGAGIIGYKIERESPVGGGFSTVVANTGSLTTSYVDSGLTRSTVYNYRVSAINSLGVGSPSAAVSATINGGGGVVVIPVAPTALGLNNSALSFTINDGSKTTTNPEIKLTLNANPQTVRGYVISLDPTFAQASITSYGGNTTLATFSLPNTFGTYNIYLKYYSVTGIYSSLLQQSITYLGGFAPAKITAQNSVSTSEIIIFKRNLKLGSKGADVKALQQFLNSHGFIISKTGAGSIGHETTTYGRSTAAAIIKFQEAYADKILVPSKLTRGNGVFGPATRQVVLAMMQ